MRGNLPGPEGVGKERGRLRRCSLVHSYPLWACARALHPLPLLANAAHADYSHRLLARDVSTQSNSSGLYCAVVQPI